jgi:hypothetical protein
MNSRKRRKRTCKPYQKNGKWFKNCLMTSLDQSMNEKLDTEDEEVEEINVPSGLDEDVEITEAEFLKVNSQEANSENEKNTEESLNQEEFETLRYYYGHGG